MLSFNIPKTIINYKLMLAVQDKNKITYGKCLNYKVIHIVDKVLFRTTHNSN